MPKPAKKDLKFKRLCLGCHKYFFKKELLKIVCSPRPEIDLNQIIPGRSFYLCFNRACQDNFAKLNKKYYKKLKFVNPKQIEDILKGAFNAN